MNPSILLVATLALASCAAATGTRHHEIPEIGLALDYPVTWSLISKSQIQSALNSNTREDLPTEGAKQSVPHIVFSIAKKGQAGGMGRNPNLMIMAVPITTEECAAANTREFVESEANEYVSTLPCASLKPAAHLTPVIRVHGYTASIPLKDRVALQHRYIFCVKDNYVVIQSTSSTPDGENEIRGIISSIREVGL